MLESDFNDVGCKLLQQPYTTSSTRSSEYIITVSGMCGRAAQTCSVVEAAAKTFRIVNYVAGINNYNGGQVDATINDPPSVLTTTDATATKTKLSQHHAVVMNTTETSIKTVKDDDDDVLVLEEEKDSTDEVDHHHHQDLMKSVLENDDGSSTNESSGAEYGSRDNYNMSPGMDAVVFWMNHGNNIATTGSTGGTCTDPTLEMKRMTWGLISRNGTTSRPLEKGIAKHFQNLMYNARSDTLYEKTTFSNLCDKHQSCIVALDGYFEWKTELGQKQPYFVHRKNSNMSSSKHPYLLIAGLWKRVTTGWSTGGEAGSDGPSQLDTFTMLTTEVCEPIKWLHTRMPVLVWDNELAIQWLKNPSCQQIHTQLVTQSQQTSNNQIQWHPVTTSMASLKFRTIDAIRPMKNQQQSVKSFFTATKKCTVKTISNPTKESSNDDEADLSDKISLVARPGNQAPIIIAAQRTQSIVLVSTTTGTASTSTTTTTGTATPYKKKEKRKGDSTAALVAHATTTPKQKKLLLSSSPSSPIRTRTIDSFFGQKKSHHPTPKKQS